METERQDIGLGELRGKEKSPPLISRTGNIYIYIYRYDGRGKASCSFL